MIKKLATTLLLCSLGFSVQAVDLEYKGFYQRLEIIKDNELDEITMGFYLVDAQSRDRCAIDKAFFYGPNVDEQAIDIADDGRLQIPYDKKLYDSFAVLRVNQVDPGQNCTLQMQIQVKNKQKTEFTFVELADYREQMQDLVDEFGGFLWFMMPDVTGLNLNLNDARSISFVHQQLKSDLNCQQLQCTLKIEEDVDETIHAKETALILSQPPVVISPWIAKD
ncbi:DUF2987 domain-containing protein [Thalassotalea mangrovi]|nr:DUF2987 domain-containing protein [Thalassotalea mangrovi]